MGEVCTSSENDKFMMGKDLCIIQVEAKTFDFFHDWIGKEKGLRIIERGSGYQSQIFLRERNISWLCDCLLEAAILDRKRKLTRTKKEGLKVLLFQRLENSRGRYALVSVLDDWGRGKLVVFPEGRGTSGWSNVRHTILEKGNIKRDTKHSYSGASKGLVGEDTGASGFLPGRTPVIGGAIIAVQGVLGIQTSYGKQVPMGLWEKAVICRCKEGTVDWDMICR